MKKHGMARLFAGAGLVVSVLAISEGAQAAPAGTQSATTEAAACAALYSVPVNVGPEPLSACQWDMRRDRRDLGRLVCDEPWPRRARR